MQNEITQFIVQKLALFRLLTLCALVVATTPVLPQSLEQTGLLAEYAREAERSPVDFGAWIYRRAFRNKAQVPPETRRLIQKLYRQERSFLRYLAHRPSEAGLPQLTVGLFRDDSRLLRANHGLNHDSIRPLASVTKIFTATAALRLVEQGRLRLEDDIARFLPDFPLARRPRAGEPITVADLLRHSTGIPYSGKRSLLLRGPVRDVQYRIASQSRPAGTKAVYSNQNFYIAGAVIEAASGRSFPDFVTGELLRPTGMHRSRVAPRANAASGMFSSINELHRFYRRLMHPGRFGPALLGRPALERMQAVPPFENPARLEAFWGLGLRLRYHHVGSRRLLEVYHNGRWTGAGSRLGYFPDADVYVVYLGTPDDFRDETYKRFHFGIGSRAAGYAATLQEVLNADWRRPRTNGG